MSTLRQSFWIFAALSVPYAHAFDSGSTGADGALTPNVDTVVSLPPDGILNYTHIDIPSGVTVRFQRNALNTPVVLLVSGDATIAGIINVEGQTAADSNGAGDGNIADDGLPGQGGPGGFAGGRGGQVHPSSAAGSPRIAQAGMGPGGGYPQTAALDNNNCYGGAGSFATLGQFPGSCGISASPTYGNSDLFPLVGGSGGAGGNGQSVTPGSGGGGGGGAILIAVSGTLNVTGSILANGGWGGRIGHAYSMTGGGTRGGGGSGGAVRLVATTLSGNGIISAIGGRLNTANGTAAWNHAGGSGRIRLEAEFFTRTSGTTPQYSFGSPGPLFVEGLPRLRVASVAGVAAPAEPTGHADIVLPADAPNPVLVVIETINVPLGNTVNLIATPPSGVPVTNISTALQGSLALATATVTINLDAGASVLLATLSYSVVEGGMQQALSRYTGGERVMEVELAANLGGHGRTVLITESGRRVAL